MSEASEALSATARRFFADKITKTLREQVEGGGWPASLWNEADALGFTGVALSEGRGGLGFDFHDIASLLFEAGRAAAPLPLGEAVLAEFILAAADLPPASGFVAVSSAAPADRLQLERGNGGWTATGVLHNVPWARHATNVVAIAEMDGKPVTILLPRLGRCSHGCNLADEPRDQLDIDHVAIPDDHVGRAGAGLTCARMFTLGAWVRCVMMSGALEGILDIAVGYAKDRVQFGKPIAKFQAIQQQMAVLASQAASAAASAAGATAALSTTGGDFEIALAKTRVGEAAGIAAAIAHQVHGAIGFTREYRLQLSTRRLWAWRDEFGGESEWAAKIGVMVAAGDGRALWPLLTAAEHG
ncbi:acyl-CoA dehydrogenase family protein [Chelativorans sp. AA-79]|uniref:acyl-CoA dehydrogenase family protein n=1 Tax=Chelativorans sp. AA-79 TaxID=3028735 RepID=UPI0023F968F1|nr:acyl-CoA dehydrogenase family protein [Chelativorans sp. AA-79]WEX12459.1 acyl-CoA/acyl-ACP dehydrogenase [Chelativorans sp. AA-79]